MTRPELVLAVQKAADEPLAGHPQRRKGMPVHIAERIIDVVAAEVLEQVTPLLEREWAGGEVLRRIRGMRAEQQ